jgi:type I restriction enzyme S subunit
MPLEKIAQIKHGKDWKNLGEGDVPVYGSGGVMGHVDTCSHDKPTVLIPRKGSITNVFYVDTPFWNVDTIFYTDIDVEQVVPRYLFHFVKTIDLMALDTGSGRPSLTQAILNRLLVPIPCPDDPDKSLAIQGEIVRILDTFTELTAELTAELAGRKKQYNHYRDQLLTFADGEVKWMALGDKDLFEVGSGGTPSKNKSEFWEGGDISWLKSESCKNEPVYEAANWITEAGLRASSAKVLSRGTTLIALVGATIFKTAFLEFEAATNQNIASIKSKRTEIVNDRYVFYYLTNLYETLKSEMRNYGMLNLTTLRQFSVPIPEIGEQERIVSILDKFETLTTSLSEGLPREIALRQQQYEYYRDQLLSFPKTEEAAEA